MFKNTAIDFDNEKILIEVKMEKKKKHSEMK